MIIVGIQQKPIYAEYGCKPSWQTDTAEGLVIGFLDPITIGGGTFPYTSTNSSWTPAGCPGAPLNYDTIYPEIESDSTGKSFSPT